jgi:hypothetical protein
MGVKLLHMTFRPPAVICMVRLVIVPPVGLCCNVEAILICHSFDTGEEI